MKKKIIEILREKTRMSFPVEEDDRTFEMLLAACALLLELASADGEFTHDERKRIYELLREEYQMFTDDIEELIHVVESVFGPEHDRKDFTEAVNDQYSVHEKKHLVELMWKIVFADGVVDEKEARLVETLAKKLGISKNEVQQAARKSNP